MLKDYTNKIIQKLGKSGYKVDDAISTNNLFIVLLERLIQLLRGFYLQIYLKNSGILFVGRNCKIKHCNKIIFGKTIIIGDNVNINALSKHGIKVGNNFSLGANSIIECTGLLEIWAKVY